METLRARDEWEEFGKMILKCILRKYGERPWNGFIWLRAGTSCGLL
jgi:hypothetical protein